MKGSTKRLQTAQFLAIAIVVFGVVFYTIGDLIKPEYSSVSNFISELNATGTAWATLLGYLGFVPLGLLFVLFLMAAGPIADVQGASRLGWLLLWSLPIAFIGVALAPCDAGCPVDGSASQALHNLISVVTYFAGAVGLILLSTAPKLAGSPKFPRYFLRFSGISFFALFVIMLSPEVAGVRGAIQRSADVLLAISILTISRCLLVEETV